MTENTQNLTEVPVKSGGCLKGCLIIFLILLVLTVGTGVTVYFVGRSYLNRQLPVWEERYPVLGLALNFLNIGKESDGVISFITEKQSGEDDKSLVPSDISLYPEPLVETYSLNKDQGVGFQRVDKPADEVSAYLLERMKKKGWELLSKDNTQEGYNLFWHKEQRTCRIEVMVYKQTSSELWIRYADHDSAELTVE